MNYDEQKPATYSPKPVQPEPPMEVNLQKLVNMLYLSVSDQRDILSDCRRFEDAMVAPRTPNEIRKIDPEKTGNNITERINHLLTVMYDTNEQLRQHRNVLEGALIAG